MTRVLSALVLLPVVLGTIWWLPPLGTLVLAEVVVLFAFVEFVALAGRLGAQVPALVTGVAVVATCAVMGLPGAPVEGTLMAATIAIGAISVGAGRRGADALHDVSASVLALLYLGLPVGALAAVRAEAGREALLLLVLVVMISDTAQYYGGRLLGRRLLAPTISPKKTIEGAGAGFVAGTIAMVAIGRWWLPGTPVFGLALLGLTLVALGIVGDLFESVLKRSAGVKDASGLIPGHGGMMDRIDSLLFAAPVYYVFLQFTGQW